jgi:hypothetical protein
MRWISLIILAWLCAGCAGGQQGPSRAPIRDSSDTGTSRTVAPEPRAVVPAPARDSVLLAATHLELHVGEQYNLFQLAPRWRDSTGTVAPMRQWIFVTPRNEIYEVSGNRLWARRPGQAALFVNQPSHSAAGAPLPRASTRVTVMVRP